MRSWLSLLRTARAPAGVLLLTGIGLVLPSQTHDMMAALTVGFGWHILAFHLAFLFLGFSAWYWARAALSARFGASQTAGARQTLYQTGQVAPGAFEWLPRLLFGTAGVIAGALLIMSWSLLNAGLVAVWILLGWAILSSRVKWLGGSALPGSPPPPQPSQPGFLLWLRKGSRERFAALLTRSPVGRCFSGTLLIVALLPFVLGGVESFVDAPSWWPGIAALVARAFPGPAAAVLGLGLMIGPLTVLTFVVDGWRVTTRVGGATLGPKRPPILAILSLWVFVLAPLYFHIHTIRVAEPSAPLAGRATLGEFFQAWAKACFPEPRSGPLRPIIVAASGGATRAGVWASRVIYDIEQATGRGVLAVFAVSSVSGGSLGTAAYMALQSSAAGPFCSDPATRNRAAKLGLDRLAPPNSLYGDALGPTLAGWLLGDMPRAIFALPAAVVRRLSGEDPRGGDSAEAIERAFEHLWAPIAATTGAPGFDQPFLSLFYRNGKPLPGRPIWIGNGTDATTGNRILTVPFRSDPASEWPFQAASDLLGMLKADVVISTAINNTARFPVLEPFGDVLPPGVEETQAEVIDGGYFENEGLRTALELAQWLRRRGQSITGTNVEPIIVQITADADPAVTLGSIVRCGSVGSAPRSLAGGNVDLQVLAPVLGLNKVRSGHSAVVLRDARDYLCTSADQHFFHFYLPGGGATEMPLNWILSDAVADRIWRSTEDEPSGNAIELACMQALFRKWMGSSVDFSDGYLCTHNIIQ